MKRIVNSMELKLFVCLFMFFMGHCPKPKSACPETVFGVIAGSWPSSDSQLLPGTVLSGEMWSPFSLISGLGIRKASRKRLRALFRSLELSSQCTSFHCEIKRSYCERTAKFVLC